MKKRIKRLQGSSYVISLEPADLLGQGSFGRVVRAYNMENRDEQIVAKIMDIGTQTRRECLEKELQILETFQSDHHNLVGYKREKLFSSKACYIIMDYCNGGTLEDRMKKKLFSEQEIYDFLGQFCSGYRELLEQNIIHRDLKPANIMIHDRLYKITDFGLAKIVNSIVDKLQISFKGTPLYMAPEMIQEEAVADAKIDMWGLGVILYRMLYQKFPFLLANKKYDRERAFEDIVVNPLVIPDFPRRSPEIVDLVRRMLEKKPKDRLSWQELFQHPKIRMTESQNQEHQTGYLMNSSMFIKQMVTQKVKVSLIKVQPFRQKKPQVEMILTEDILKQQVKKIDEEQKLILDEMVSQLNKKMSTSKVIHEIEDKLLFLREQVFFYDKVALRVYRLNKFDKNIILNVSLNLLEKALQLIGKLLKLAPLSEVEVQQFKSNQGGYEVFIQMIKFDEMGLNDFRNEIKSQIQKNIPNPNLELYQLAKGLDDNFRQVYITIKYLKDSEQVEKLGFREYEEFWLYYEEVESTEEQEAKKLIAQII